MELRGKVALVTGAAHRLGKAIALALAGRGASIVVHYGSSGDEAAATADEIRRLGVDAWPLAADLADPLQIESLLTAAHERAGRLDVVVASAASFERKPFEQITAEDWDRVQAVNLRAPFLLLRGAAALLRASRREGDAPAAVVNVLDLASRLPWRGYAHHGAAKAGLAHLTRIAARELAPAIRVNAVAPGAILPPPGMKESDEAWRATAERLPLHRTGDPREIGNAVVFLAETDFVTGEVLVIDGGESLIGSAHR